MIIQFPTDGGSSSDDNELPDIPPEQVRFNKFTAIDTTFQGLPLGPDDYPISDNPEVVTFLKEGSDSESVVDINAFLQECDNLWIVGNWIIIGTKGKTLKGSVNNTKLVETNLLSWDIWEFIVITTTTTIENEIISSEIIIGNLFC